MTSWIQPALFTITPHIGGYLTNFFSRRNNFGKDGWYTGLSKPPFTPPNWAFAPVWFTLYTGMGYASYLIYRDGGGVSGENALPLALYGTQLALNWSWTPLFFGMHRTGLAMINITCCWGTVAGCIWAFSRVNRTASYLLLPYLTWLSLASAINFWVWRNNKPSIQNKQE